MALAARLPWKHALLPSPRPGWGAMEGPQEPLPLLQVCNVKSSIQALTARHASRPAKPKSDCFQLRSFFITDPAQPARRLLNLSARASMDCEQEALHSGSQAPDLSNDEGRFQTERGTNLLVGPSFYKPESTPSRDLAVLAALIHKKHNGLRVLDVMSGCGVRGARYLDQAGADFVWANDAWEETHAPLVANLSAASGDPDGFSAPLERWQLKHAAKLNGSSYEPREEVGIKERQQSHSGASTSNGVHSQEKTTLKRVDADEPAAEMQSNGVGHQRGSANGESLPVVSHLRVEAQERLANGDKGSNGSRSTAPDTLRSTSSEGTKTEGECSTTGKRSAPKWHVSHFDATKLLNSCSQNEDFYDIVDIDSFGSDSAFLGDALRAVRYGGMVYVTSTDGFALAGGHRPEATLAAYGSYARPVPFGNELGLRILIGTVVREGAMRGLRVFPLFSHFAPHGPVFRAMLRVEKTNRGQWEQGSYAFVGHCFLCGQSKKAGWQELGSITCPCQGPDVLPRPMAVVGPLWTGPLHCADFVEQMIEESKHHSWTQTEAEGYGRRPAGESMRPKGKSVYSFRDLDHLLQLMREESEPLLPPYLIKVDDIYKRGKTSPVNKMELCQELELAGFVVARSHVSAGAIKTNASIEECIHAAKACAQRAQERKQAKAAAKMDQE